MHFSAAVVSFALFAVAAVNAIQVTAPADGAIWSVEGPNTVSWSSVSTDPANFEIVLVNPDFSTTQVLVAQQSTSSKTVQVRAPSGNFPTGSKWRINLMSIATTTQQSGILAQSGYFNITDAVSSSSVTTSNIPTTMTGMTTTAAAASTGLTAATGTITGASSTSQTDLNPTGTSGAKGFFQLSAGLVAAVAAVHALAF